MSVVIAILCLNVGLSSAGHCPVPSVGYSRARIFASGAGCTTVIQKPPAHVFLTNESYCVHKIKVGVHWECLETPVIRPYNRLFNIRPFQVLKNRVVATL